jgi:probable F420-dependent oxidoreductase
MFHEPFVLFGYLAAFTKLELVSAVIILPQRQTALVAKQAAEVDVLSGGRLRLGIGVGWNQVEYEALGMDFKKRGKIVEEQIEVLRQLWGQEVVNFKGQFHTITAAGLNPLPVKKRIPIWLGGSADALLRRVALLGDGWFPQGRPDDKIRTTLEQLYKYVEEAGRDPKEIGIEARVSTSDGNIDQLARWTEQWRELGATHIAINTMNTGYKTLEQHIEALRRYKEAT